MPGSVSPWVGAPLPHQAPGGTASPSIRRLSAASLLPPAAACFNSPRDIFGHAQALAVQVAQVALRRGLLVQLRRPLVALGHALAEAVQHAQPELRISTALGRRLLVQLRRPLVALGHALALAVQEAQVVLRSSIALRRSLLKQLGRPLVALRHAQAAVIAAAQSTQRLRLAPGSASHVLRGGRPDALGSGGGGRASPALADPHHLTRLPLRRRHPARRLVALPVRALAL